MNRVDPLVEYMVLLRIRRKGIRRNSIFLGVIFSAALVGMGIYLPEENGAGRGMVIFLLLLFTCLLGIMHQVSLELINKHSIELIEVILRRNEQKEG